MALLEMVNSVRGKLREERIATISSTDLLTTEIVELINDAGSEILEGDDWEFDVRHDGRLWYPASQSGTHGLFGSHWDDAVYENETTVFLFYQDDTDPGDVFEDMDLAGFRCSGNRMRARVVPTDSSFGNTSWIISTVIKGANSFRLTTADNLYFTAPAQADPGDWTTYANEVVLPSAVKEVLSVRNEEEPIRLEFADREIQFDRAIPRSTDSFGSVPEVVIVGGTITSTARVSTGNPWDTISDETAVTGTGCMVWPIPSADIHLEYSYRVQHADLSEDTDEWSGVPQNVIRMIEWRAFQGALDSGIQNDPEAAQRAERQVEKRRLRAQASQSRQPNRRRIPTAFGTRGHSRSRARWASQSITAPI
jgi:hypothetical protein